MVAEAVVEIRLLGRVEVTDGDGRVLDIGPPKCRALLAGLALSPGVAVPVDRLVEIVWDGEPPRTAAKTLQTYISRLRKAIGSDLISRDGEAYRLDVEPGAVDVGRFRRRLADGDPAGALAQWGGPPLAGVGGDALQPVVDGLNEQRLAAVEADLAALVDTDPAAAIGPLTEACQANPYREELVGLLMVALFRSGRQADALSAYRAARHRLVEELGVEPGPGLQAIEAGVLAHDPSLLAVTPATPATPAAPAAPSDGNLPAAASSLVGRDDELGEIVEAVGEDRLVTLVGPGGIGKTRLALAVAWGVVSEAGSAGPVAVEEGWFVPLAGVADPADVEGAVTGQLGMVDDPGGSLARSLRRALRGRRMLIVLDNCEHVIDAAASVARSLVEAGPEVRVLATSREPLGLSGERVFNVPPLVVDGAAVELFGRRGVEADRGFDLEGERSAVVEICRRLDGLPLAIELAAARVRSLNPTQILERLDDRLRLLSGGRRTDDERHRTLRSTISWSYELLEPAERELFRRLSVFAGPFDLAAAEAVAREGSELDVDDGLDRLVTRSMIDSVPGTGRYRLLETVAQYGREELAHSPSADDVAAAHAGWCRAEVESIGAGLATGDEWAAAARLTERWADLRAAVTWALGRGDHETVRALLEPIATEVYVRNRSEIGIWAERLLDIAPPAVGDLSDTRIFALTWAARRYMRRQDRTGFAALVARETTRYGPPQDPMIGYAWGFLADDLDLRAETAPRCVERYRARGEDYKADLFAVAALAPTLLALGRLAEHDEMVGELVDRFRRDGPPTGLGWALVMQALSHRIQGRVVEADRCLRESSSIVVPPGTANVTRGFEARSLHDRGRRRRAYAMLADHIDEAVTADDVFTAKLALHDYVHMMVGAGHLDRAAEVVGHLTGSRSHSVVGAPEFGEVVAEGDDPDGRLAAAWDRGRGLDDRQLLATVVESLAELAASS